MGLLGKRDLFEEGSFQHNHLFCFPLVKVLFVLSS